MGKFLLLMTLLGDLPDVPLAYQEAAHQTRYALMEYPFVKSELKNLGDDAEKELYIKTGLTRDQLAYVIYVYPLVAGKLSTKPIGELSWKPRNMFTIRPDMEYNIYSHDTTSSLVLLKEF